ncbi:MAG: hypothetical protein IKI19_06535, partial [Prevotella sp.]|nr:hypothetical protein [Prevotella sp.]
RLVPPIFHREGPPQQNLERSKYKKGVDFLKKGVLKFLPTVVISQQVMQSTDRHVLITLISSWWN